MMSGRIKIFLKCIGLSLFLSTSLVNAQVLQDTNSLYLIRKDIDYIYNLQFNNAREVYKEFSKLYPEHPFVFLLRGIQTYWENYPLLNTTPAHVSFEEDMRRCIRLSEENNNPVYEEEYLLANLCARGMLLVFYVDNDLIIKVTPLAASTYKYIRHSFDFTSVCTDLYYFTGIYNYYREAYPREYPVYKSLAILFPGGDLEMGLKELHTAALNSVVLKGESYFLLTWIYLNYERNYPTALYYCKSLHELYPGNVLYLAVYLKNLLLMKQYDEAEKLIIASTEGAGNRYFQEQLSIFNGILQEKKYLDNNLAQQYYKKGISDISFFGGYGNEYAAYAYYGLSRISEARGEKHICKIYRKEAMKLAEFKRINFDE
jgi:hypothetical protein